MLDIAFISLLDFLVRTQDAPERASATPRKTIAIPEEMIAKPPKAEIAAVRVTGLSRFPNLSVD
jgi:hypothetical protein